MATQTAAITGVGVGTRTGAARFERLELWGPYRPPQWTITRAIGAWYSQATDKRAQEPHLGHLGSRVLAPAWQSGCVTGRRRPLVRQPVVSAARFSIGRIPGASSCLRISGCWTWVSSGQPVGTVRRLRSTSGSSVVPWHGVDTSRSARVGASKSSRLVRARRSCSCTAAARRRSRSFPLFEHLEGVRAIAVDRPGFGLSEPVHVPPERFRGCRRVPRQRSSTTLSTGWG